MKPPLVLATVLMDNKGGIVSVYADEKAAHEKRDRFNRDPNLDSETADPDAPYRCETWVVR